MADLLETPSRLLKRVQQYEDMDLPSLPSISHDVECDQTTEYPDPDDSVTSGNEEWSTPQVGRPFPSPPFPSPPVRLNADGPEPGSFARKPSPLASNDSFSDFHSSPQRQLSDEEPSFLADLSKSRNIPSKSSVPAANDSDFWDDSLASRRLPATNADADHGSDTDLSLHETTADSSSTSVMDTPLPRHYQRRPVGQTQPAVTGPGPGPENRIPSLTRSEVSGTDQEATTPDGLDRILETTSIPTFDPTEASVRSVDGAEFSDHDQTQQSEEAHHKLISASSQTVTPAVMRFMDTPDTAVRAAATPFGVGAALRDVTRRHANTAGVPNTPFTPSVDYNKTPRAALDDAERRKNHVLSVLASSTLPARVKRFTPHPRRRLSVDTGSELIAGETSFLSKPGDESRSVNESFISVASSQDLTPDRRGSRAFNQRVNTSVPNILYSGAVAASPGVSHLDNRPDTVKIQKHLNMMNQQLLDNNADLAREAEEWRSECTRLIGIMREAGIQIDDDGNIIGELPKSCGDGDSLDHSSAVGSSRRDTGKAATGHSHIRRSQMVVVEEDEENTASLRSEGLGQGDSSTLRRELEESRRAHDALKAEFAQKTKDHTLQFTEICTEFEAQVRQLEAQVHRLTDELETAKAATLSAGDHEAEMAAQRARITHLEAKLTNSTSEIALLRAETKERTREFQETKHRASELQERLSALDRASCAASHALQESEKACATASTERESAVKEVEETRRLLEDMKRVVATNQAIMEEQRLSLNNLEDLAGQEHKDLEETQARLRDARRELSDAHSQLSDKDREIENLRAQVDTANVEKSACLEVTDVIEVENSILRVLEDRLETAHKEIGRLKHEARSTPIHQSTLEARDAHIAALETEKLVLMERLKAHEVSSPARWSSSMMTSTPLPKTVSSLKYPCTPGPLKDISWLQTTIGDSNESILRAQLDHLHHELDLANSQLDRNFARLEEAGFSAVELAEKLAAANTKIAVLEEELALLARERMTTSAEASAGQDRNERLENALETVREQMAVLKDDMSREKERLQDDNRRLRVMLADVQSKADEEIEALGMEIAQVQRESEDHVNEYRERLQTLRDERDSVDVKLRALRGTVETLQHDLRDARIEASDAGRREATVQEQEAKLASQQTTIQSVQRSLSDARQAAQDLQALLEARTEELEASQNRVRALDSERSKLARDLREFTDDLDHHRRESVKFGFELAALRNAQDTREAAYAEHVANLTHQLSRIQEESSAANEKAEEARNRHTQLSRELATLESTSRDASLEQRQKYKVQTRRLAAQIEYLKAKYTRENTFRNALALQKKFLLLLVGGMSLTEQATLKVIASMGYERSAPARPKLRLKTVAIAVLSVVRAGRIAKEWRTTREVRAVGTARG